MRRLLLRKVPDEIQKVIRKKAREDHIGNDEAVIELIRDLQVELAVQHDIALMEKRWEDEQDEEFGPPIRRPLPLRPRGSPAAVTKKGDLVEPPFE